MTTVDTTTRKITEQQLFDIMTIMGDMDDLLADSIIANLEQSDDIMVMGFVATTGDPVCYEHDKANGGFWICRVLDIEDCEIHLAMKIQKCKVDGRKMYLVRGSHSSIDFILEPTMYAAKREIERIVEAAYDRAASW